MTIIQIILICIVAAFLFIIVKEVNAPIAFVIVLCTSMFVLFVVMIEITKIIQLLQSLAQLVRIDSIYIQTIFKIVGIAYITEFAANMMRDAGLSSIGSNIELAGKVFILILAIPIIQAVIQIILQFIPTEYPF